MAWENLLALLKALFYSFNLYLSYSLYWKKIPLVLLPGKLLISTDFYLPGCHIVLICICPNLLVFRLPAHYVQVKMN